MAIHTKEQLQEVEKLAYLRDTLKNGPAKNVIKGLEQTAESYQEAIRCLQECYNRPRLIHQVHIRAILEVPLLKDGNGLEPRHLHDVINQNARVLAATKHDTFKSLITSIVELKLDLATMFVSRSTAKNIHVRVFHCTRTYLTSWTCELMHRRTRCETAKGNEKQQPQIGKLYTSHLTPSILMTLV